MRTFVALALAAVPASLLALTFVGGSPDAQSGSIPTPLLKREPVLNFDVTGGTLTGPLHQRYTVYNDGLITGSDCGGPFGTNSGGTASVSATEAETLRKVLIQAGGMVLPDQNIFVSDVPFTTVTVFVGDTDAKAHTFSYWLGTGAYATIDQKIADFMAAHPAFCQGIISEF